MKVVLSLTNVLDCIVFKCGIRGIKIVTPQKEAPIN